jgi:hypothetical protein
MDNHVISSIPGIHFYPVISLAIFFAIFAVVVIWYFRSDRARLAQLAASALEDATPATSGDHQIR